ncbi:GlsB/YeaQ/YmgE family stress response membrane protein [Ferrovum sp.]|uniref:GlsB/YeaQ/YmgE family stress response membrane protein n=1 Tax=Ferrovum sp. TaxID=2609467 RepID=UPI0023239BAA|nr:GlsB/YeaQ/YmgE family stress response membrane protein [Ferrovum sp.]MDA8383718.1 GlsB/YeaQ/YmgE family stress response membrane protein [Betaproteobacteria bacterium]
MALLWFILIGLVAGWLAGVLVRGGGFGVLGDIIVGVVGALIGGYVFSALGTFPGGGLLGSLIVATLGAVILILLLRLVARI